MIEIIVLMQQTNDLAKFSMLPKIFYANAWVEKDKMRKGWHQYVSRNA